MKKDSRELASQLLDITNEALAPAYEDIRTKLLGSLATSSIQIESLREETAQRKANQEFINSFSALLPKAKKYESKDAYTHKKLFGSKFEVEDAYTVRLLQATQLWHSDHLGYDSHWYAYPDGQRPFYIIGKRSNDKRTDLLLLSADEPSEGLRTVTMKNKVAKRFMEERHTLLFSEPDQTEVQKMYQKGTGNLLVQSTSPNIKHTTQTIYRNPSEVKIANFQVEKVGPTDNDMAQFQVLEHLNNLATAFGVVEKYQELLAADKTE
ncbi:MAG TPA: hypothetical protein VFI84_02380 [Candidatus Saccharimonadales bacterium]|nr:hypothetical protein [Candidatus Saccharimonadales bacterium]